MSNGVTTMQLSDGTLALIEPETQTGLDRRVFRRTGPGRESLEWAHLNDVENHGPRARWYGWHSKDLPDTMRSF